MPVAKGSRLDPKATRSRLLGAATRLFYAQSTERVGVNHIVAEAGASKLSLYRNFPSKDDLVAEVVARRSERVHAWLRRETAQHDDAMAVVLSIFDLLIDWYAQPGYSGCAVMNAATDARGGEDGRVRETARQHLQRFRELLAERIAPLGHDRERTELLASQLLLLIEGATAVSAIDGASGTAGTAAREAARSLLESAAAQP
jgi:AcrR family transcriptional regulator